MSYLDLFDLTGKVAVITGASEGIGQYLASGLADAGAHVVLCSRREEKLLEVQADIRKNGGDADIFRLNVIDLNNIVQLGSFIAESFNHLDILVNNAGYVVNNPAWNVTETEWDEMVDIGLKGVFFCSQILSQIMKEQKYGKIINLSSTFSKSIVHGRSVYCTIKAGVSHLTEALAVEWAPYGIRVNALAPTAVITPSREKTLKGETLQGVLKRIPLGRLAKADDLIGAAIFLASAASDFVTGHTLFVDGGWIAAS